jgi:hypothetical protein
VQHAIKSDSYNPLTVTAAFWRNIRRVSSEPGSSERVYTLPKTEATATETKLEQKLAKARCPLVR